VAVDTWGNLFIADGNNNRIRKVDTNGIITTVAGDGINSFFGDGVAATNAGLYAPNSVAVDAVGNLFISDQYNYRVRRVNTNGIITTVAGNGILYANGDGGMAISAGLSPTGVAVDTVGNLFITDGNNRIRKVNTNGIITTVVGKGGDGGAATNGTLCYPSDVAVDSIGNMFIADSANVRIRKVYNPFSLPSLALNIVSNAEAGNYSVIITSSSGSVTSSVVALKVVSLNITAPTVLANRQFQFSFDTATDVNYAVQYSTNLTQWFPFVTLGGIGVPLTLIDPDTAASQQRFYRFVLSPQ